MRGINVIQNVSSWRSLFDREQRSKVLKEALLLFLLLFLAWKHEKKALNGTKMFANKICSKLKKICYKTKKHIRERVSCCSWRGNMSKSVSNWTKKFREQNMYQMKQKCSRTKFVPNWTKFVTKGTKNVHERVSSLKWQNVFLSHFTAMCGLLWLCMVLYGLFMVSYGIFLVLHGRFMVFYGRISFWLDLHCLFSRSLLRLLFSSINSKRPFLSTYFKSSFFSFVYKKVKISSKISIIFAP